MMGNQRDGFLWVRLVVALTLLLSTPSAAVGGSDASEIMQRTKEQQCAGFEVAHMRMELVNESGDVLTRELRWHFRSRDGQRYSLLKFLNPPNVRHVGLLVRERAGEPVAVWHYLPATRSVRRISSRHRRNRFMGTEFVFEDLMGLMLDKYAFERLRSEVCADGRICDVVEARAVDPTERADTGYTKKLFWVDRANAFVHRTDLFGTDGMIEKRISFSAYRAIGPYWRPSRQIIRNFRNGHETRLIDLHRVIDVPFDAYYASHQYLRSE